MAWCKVSSLTAAVAVSLASLEYPASRGRILREVSGVKAEGWELRFFLDRALTSRSYADLRSVMAELEDWLGRQG